MQHSGESTGSIAQVWTVNGPKTFEGNAAVETLYKHTGTLTTAGVTSATNTDLKAYQKRTGDFEVTLYGSESTIAGNFGGFDVVQSMKVVYTPPLPDRQFGLAVGQSVTQTQTLTTTSTTTGIPNVPVTPRTNTNTSTQTVKFVGREQVTVPAKTFSACKFETTYSAGNIKITTWVIDGKGIPVKIQTTSNGAVSSTEEATVVKLNGQNL
jgi:hypothetical protein